MNGSTTAGTCGTAGAAGTFEVTTWKTNVSDTVDVTPSTVFVEPEVSSPSFADVCVGEFVGAIGTVTGSTVSPTKVFVAPVRKPPSSRGVFGTVASVNGVTTAGTCGSAGAAGTFTLMTWKHTTSATVAVTATTIFVEPGTSSPSFANVCVGELVGAQGPISGTTVTATKVGIIPVIPPRPQGAFGTVTSVNGSTATGTCGTAGAAGSFTLSSWRISSGFTVNVGSTTTFVDPGVSSPSFANVCVGEMAGAVGSVSGTTVTATKVFVAPPVTPIPRGVFGTVASVNGSSATGTCGTAGATGSFTVTTWMATMTYTVNVSASTNFVEPGGGPSFANVCVGGIVGAVGPIAGSTVSATTVYLAPPAPPVPFWHTSRIGR